jgi:hypothetical protein
MSAAGIGKGDMLRRVTFSVCLVVLTTWMGIQQTAHAQSIVRGKVYAATPCELSRPSGSALIGCVQVVVPLEARLVVISHTGRRFLIETDKNGEFSKALPSGRYGVRLARASADGKPVPVPLRYLKLSRTSFVVRGRSAVVDFGISYHHAGGTRR